MPDRESEHELVRPRDVSEAAARLRDHLQPTPFIASRAYGELITGEVWLKCEHRQPTGSFKVRGALNALLRLDPEARARGVVTASSGNHGAAVAWVAQRLGISALVFTARTASAAKLRNIARFGGELRLESGEYVRIEALARAHAAERGLRYIPPYNDADVVAGQGTAGVEIAAAAGTLDAVFATVGGGGLIGGIAIWLKHCYPNVKIIGCLPENSPHMLAAVRGANAAEVEHLPTLSDGSAGSIEPDSMTIGLCRGLVDEFVVVSEKEIARELRACIDHEHELVEGSAAVSLAGLRRLAPDLRGRKAAVVLSGGNIASTDLHRALELTK